MHGFNFVVWLPTARQCDVTWLHSSVHLRHAELAFVSTSCGRLACWKKRTVWWSTLYAPLGFELQYCSEALGNEQKVSIGPPVCFENESCFQENEGRHS